MATINKIMKTFNVPDGNDIKCYEIFDDKGRKMAAVDWYEHSTEAFAVGDYIVKDGVVYKFTGPHTANTAWDAAEVSATTLTAELKGKKNLQTAVSDPSVDGNGISFIDSISQNEQGVISPHKKNVSTMGAASAGAAGTAGLVPAPGAGDQDKVLKGNGTWGAAGLDPNDIANNLTTTEAGKVLDARQGKALNDAKVDKVNGKGLSTNDFDNTYKGILDGAFTGATSQANGEKGLVPAPTIAQRKKFLCGSGTWEDVEGGKLIVFDLDTVTNTSGNYTHTTTIADATHDMKAIMLEIDDPSVFGAPIDITVSDGSITLSCTNVAGTTDVSVSLMFVANADPLTSTEFDVLSNRIGTLGSLKTTNKSDLVSAVNEVHDQVDSLKDSFAPDQYSTSGITFVPAEATYVKGGYIKIGKLCILNVTFTKNNSSSGLSTIATFADAIKPLIDTSLECVEVNSDTGPYYSVLSAAGSLLLKNSSQSGKQHNITGVYLCAN